MLKGGWLGGLRAGLAAQCGCAAGAQRSVGALLASPLHAHLPLALLLPAQPQLHSSSTPGPPLTPRLVICCLRPTSAAPLQAGAAATSSTRCAGTRTSTRRRAAPGPGCAAPSAHSRRPACATTACPSPASWWAGVAGGRGRSQEADVRLKRGAAQRSDCRLGQGEAEARASAARGWPSAVVGDQARHSPAPHPAPLPCPPPRPATA